MIINGFWVLVSLVSISEVGDEESQLIPTNLSITRSTMKNELLDALEDDQIENKTSVYRIVQLSIGTIFIYFLIEISRNYLPIYIRKGNCKRNSNGINYSFNSCDQFYINTHTFKQDYAYIK